MRVRYILLVEGDRMFRVLERRILIGITALQALMAIGGGIGLMVNGLGMPLTNLQSSPFSSYVWPGIILFTMLGLTNLAAAALLVVKSHKGLTVAAVGGLAALGWIIGELYATPVINWMQLFVAVLSGVQIVLIMLLLGLANSERRLLWTR